MGLKWYGEDVKRRVRQSARNAVQATITEAAAEAAASWPVETGASADSIEVLDAAHEDGSRVVGVWGGRQLPASSNYTESSRDRVLFNEIGVEGRPGLGILRRTGDALNATLAGRVADEFRR